MYIYTVEFTKHYLNECQSYVIYQHFYYIFTQKLTAQVRKHTSLLRVFLVLIVLIGGVFVQLAKHDTIPRRLVTLASAWEMSTANRPNNSRPNTSSEHDCPYQQRRQQLVAACESLYPNSNLRPVRSGTHARQLIVDIQHRTAICLVPKVASTSLKTLLVNASTHPKAAGVNPKYYSQLSSIGLKAIKELKPSLADSVIGSRQFERFIMVRHPIDRLLSAYRDKMRLKPIYKPLQVGIMKYYKDAANTGSKPSLMQFVKFLTAKISSVPKSIRWFHDNLHWNTQSDMCSPCDINYDYILKYETLNEDIPIFLRRLYGERSKPLISTNKSTSDPSKTEKSWKALPNALRTKILHKYAADIRLFGYCNSDSFGNVCNNSDIKHD